MDNTTLFSLKVLSRRRSIRPPLRRIFLLITLAFAYSALPLAQKAFGVSPPPDGGYPNFNTAEGDAALFNLTGGFDNTAIGDSALFSNTGGNDNTGTGYHVLLNN